ncbi:hypothetical protein BVX98_05490 [bacterium F11]|nr:hypothetical protein BVX98_05490 [bacterium F11]
MKLGILSGVINVLVVVSLSGCEASASRESPSTVGIDVDSYGIINQYLYSGSACGPTSVLNALKFGKTSFQSIYRGLSGYNDKDKLRFLINQYGSKASQVERGETLYGENRGMKADDILPFFNSILKDHSLENVQGTYFERKSNESTIDHLYRIHQLLSKSLLSEVPIITSIRSFASQERSSDSSFKWQGVAAHVILITRVPKDLKSSQKGFPFNYIDPDSGSLYEGYIYVEDIRDFHAIKGSGETDFKWIEDSPFLLVIAPHLNLDTKKQKWHWRSFITLNYGVGNFND